jgi:hypothetical protein
MDMNDWLEGVWICRRCGNSIYPSLEGKVLHGQHLPWCPSARIYDSPWPRGSVFDISPFVQFESPEVNIFDRFEED